jgi:hypothetical protein
VSIPDEVDQARIGLCLLEIHTQPTKSIPDEVDQARIGLCLLEVRPRLRHPEVILAARDS